MTAAASPYLSAVGSRMLRKKLSLFIHLVEPWLQHSCYSRKTHCYLRDCTAYSVCFPLLVDQEMACCCRTCQKRWSNDGAYRCRFRVLETGVTCIGHKTCTRTRDSQVSMGCGSSRTREACLRNVCRGRSSC